jgi:hypothetical protein
MLLHFAPMSKDVTHWSLLQMVSDFNESFTDLNCVCPSFPPVPSLPHVTARMSSWDLENNQDDSSSYCGEDTIMTIECQILKLLWSVWSVLARRVLCRSSLFTRILQFLLTLVSPTQYPQRDADLQMRLTLEIPSLEKIYLVEGESVISCLSCEKVYRIGFDWWTSETSLQTHTLIMAASTQRN